LSFASSHASAAAMPLRHDIWRVGVVRAPIAELLAAGAIGRQEVVWLAAESRPFTFLADPFGLWRDDRLHLFAEAYDYRDRHGRIELLILDSDFAITERRTVLTEPWHLSYPFVFEAEGESWMLPEAFRSGRLTLYRAAAFPDRWEPAAAIELDSVGVDATPLFHGGLWWLLYSPSADRLAKIARLHLAYAERLTGPWRCHPGNPVRIDRTSSRPGGTPVMVGDRLMAPMQDCTSTYGGAIRPLWIDRLDPDGFAAEAGPAIAPPPGFAPTTEGLHTLSSCGPVTLVDAKRTVRSLAGLGVELGRLIRRRAGREPRGHWRRTPPG
jgi:hypothetical protein